MFPAHAGVILLTAGEIDELNDVSRTRGGDPVKAEVDKWIK